MICPLESRRGRKGACVAGTLEGVMSQFASQSSSMRKVSNRKSFEMWRGRPGSNRRPPA